MKRTLALLLALCLTAASASALEIEDPLFGEIDEILGELARISGLKHRKNVKYDRIERGQVKAFIQDRIKETVKPEEIRAEETVLKKLGFVPQDFDLEKTTVDLLSEQAAAFYDYRKKKLFVIEGSPDLIQHSALVHELAHALADQHFDLNKYIQHGKSSDDGALARLAVMEGQATWLMSEYLTRRTGQSLIDSPVLLNMMARSTEASAGQFPVFDRAPLYLRETLVFPYTQGMRFQHAVIEKLDKSAFAEVFRRPPASTQHILHPEKYLDGIKPAAIELPKPEGVRGYKEFVEGELGELDHAILLRQYAGEKESDALAPQWRGGRYSVRENRKEKRTILLYASLWDTPESARRFFELYRKVLAGKWTSLEINSDTPNALAGRSDDGYFRVALQGERVTSIEGLPAALH